MTLEDAIHHLQLQGLNIIYSSDVMNPQMVLKSDPKATTPRAILDEILAMFYLKVQSGPRKTLLIVHGHPPDPPKKKADTSSELKPPKEFLVIPYVSIDVSARSHNHFITTLKPEDFIIRENGQELRIDQFYGPNGSGVTDIPLTILFLMDSSQSMTPDTEELAASGFVKQSALRLGEELRQGDQAMVMEFNEKSWIASQMTTRLDVIHQTIMDYKVGPGWTGLLDAVQSAVKNLETFSGRKIIILCSDGKDNASKTKLENVLLSVQASDVTILAVGPKFRGYLAQRGREVLEKIAEESGGYAFFPENNQDIEAMLEEAKKAMRSQYAIGYAPPNPFRRGWRKVEIECRIEGVRLRYRKSYLF